MIEKYKLMSRMFFTAVWFQLCWVFICTELIPALSPTRSFVLLGADIIYLMLGLATLKSRRDIFVFVSFFVIASASAIVNHQGITVYANGMRDFFGVLFTVPVIRYFLNSRDASRFVRSVDRQLYIFLWIQVPCLLFQFIKYGAGDSGGGSLGSGGSGLVTTLIYAISFYLINKKWDEDKSYFKNLWHNRILVLLLFSTFLNETKIGFIYMLAYFVLLMKVDRRFVLRMILSSPLLLLLFMGMGYLYLIATDSYSERFDESFFIDYFIGEDFDGVVEMAINVQYLGAEYDNIPDLPRFSRFLLLPEALGSTEGGFVLGAGIGQYKGGSVMAATEFARNYQWLLSGSDVTTFFIIVQLGVVGLIWLVYAVFSVVFTPDKHIRANNILLYMFTVFFFMFIYDEMVRYAYGCFILFYISMYGLQPASNKENEIGLER